MTIIYIYNSFNQNIPINATDMKKHKKQKTEIKRANNLQKKIEKHRKKVQKIKKERRKKKMKDLFSLFLLLLILMLHPLVTYNVTKILCYYYGMPAKGTIAGDYYMYIRRRNRLVGRYYEFSHNGKCYTGEKYSLKEQVGDTVDIVYIKCCPYLNVAMGTYSDKAQMKIIQRNKEQDLIK